MAKIQIDGTQYEVKPEKNLLENCLALGFDIPYFCFHPAMGSIGACRLCAVKKYSSPDDKKGRIVMSCMEPVTEGMIISVNDPEARAFRESVLEGLMANHPHDCPVCDEGGECHLQDMTVMTGHNYRRYTFKKRTHTNQYLGPFIKHEMNRCIQCYRCVRFYRNYAGGKDLNVYGSASRVYFGRQKDGVLENEFSGNLAEVCPTGVFTDKTFNKHFARKWDLAHTPSVCAHCSLGCNTIVSERYKSVRRVMSRYNGAVNGYFICDRGRFGYEFITSPNRIRAVKGIPAITAKNGRKMMGIGSPRASLESNFALMTLVGKENFSSGISAGEDKLIKKALQIISNGMVHTPSLKEIEQSDAILVLGEDVTNTAPMMALAVRQAARAKSLALADKLGIPEWNDYAVRELDQDGRGPVFIASPFSTKLDELAEVLWYAAPQDIAGLGFAVASLLDTGAPVISVADDKLRETAQRIANALSAAEHPLIISGIAGGTEEILNACANIAIALQKNGKKPSVSIAFPETNSVGSALLDGCSLDEMLEKISKEKIDSLIVIENDLYLRAPKEKIDSALENCGQLIVADHLMHATAEKADVLLPAATFAETAGTVVSNEGRAQRYYSALPPAEPIKASWLWMTELLKESGGAPVKWENLDEVMHSLGQAYPVFARILTDMPDASYRCFNEKVARQTMRSSGRTSMNSNITVNEPKPPQDSDSPLAYSMEGYKGNPPAPLIPYYWSPGWNSVQASNKYLDEPAGHVRNGGDPGVLLFDGAGDAPLEYFRGIPLPFKPAAGEMLFVPVHRIFGSEELSSQADAISERIPESFVVVNEKYVDRIKELVNVAVKVDPNVPDGVAGVFRPVQGATFNID